MRVYPPIPEASGIMELAALARSAGFAVLRGANAEALEYTLRELGDVLYIEEVETRAGSRALVTSDRALPPHTDHHRARWIVWACSHQADRGGDSLVVDGLEVLALLTREQQEVLTRVQLIEHSVFVGDMEQHAMLTRRPEGQIHLYYSYWLAEDTMPAEEQAAFDAFTDASAAASRPKNRGLAQETSTQLVSPSRPRIQATVSAMARSRSTDTGSRDWPWSDPGVRVV